jgi:hypothetical protein
MRRMEYYFQSDKTESRQAGLGRETVLARAA